MQRKLIQDTHPDDRVREEAVETAIGRVYAWPAIMSNTPTCTPAYENLWVLHRLNKQRQRES